MGDSESSSENVNYTVQPGDTLSKIAREFYGDDGQYARIYEANRDKLNDPNDIKVGQELTIPPATS
jgi:nucleoid-associated protein YgaU